MLVGQAVRDRFGASVPTGTLVVNVAGAFVLGLLVGGKAGPGWLALLGTGFCGAFTTFSSLALEIWQATEDGDRLEPTRIVALTVVLGVGAAAAGYALTA
ncbi:fluoride efflux transporter CrcB [Phycicoccus sp. CMS6Z-2]|nr:fluoride efflux transporter CrcB [Phycicoccus flavus]